LRSHFTKFAQKKQLASFYLKKKEKQFTIKMLLNQVKIYCMLNNFFTITGGPGAGKTALITELKKRGYYCVDEVAREVIQEQMAIEGTGVPWKDLKLFKEIMLSRFIETYQIATKYSSEIIFFDRDVLDLVAYDRLTNSESSKNLKVAVQTLIYNEKVFVAPPWEAIYCIDDERKQTFEESIKVYNGIIQVYSEYGREIILLPQISVEDRADFVINHI
jgi:predicted ATPase